jgi:hypothetical protein
MDEDIQRLPWGAIKEKNFNIFLNNINSDNKKPGEYIMHLIFHNFVIISSKKIDQILYGDRRVCIERERERERERIYLFIFIRINY